jgi:catechol 2,3-dioxygenase-like lactoylglutathione lyase family enzyme
MAIRLNHTIVSARDKQVSAQFLAEVLGLPAPFVYGPFLAVQLADHATVDFADTDDDITSVHLAFLVDDEDFDGLHARIVERGIPHWADPARARPGEVNTDDGGRGVYFEDPSGHFLEAITVPYGGF